MRSPHTSYRWRGESQSANQVDALTTNQLQVERRERHRPNQVYALATHQLQVERRESKCQSSVCSHHNQLKVERRERHRPNQEYALATHQLQVERRESKRQSSGCSHHKPGLHPYSLREEPWDFLMTTESQDLGLTSQPKDAITHFLFPFFAINS